MCLFTNQKKPLIADRDIICYKIVRRTRYSRRFESLYTHFPYELGKTYKKHFWNRVVKEKTLISESRIYGGVFHSYRRIQSHHPADNLAYVQCIIPKGTKYYEGLFGDLCSRAIKIVQVI